MYDTDMLRIETYADALGKSTGDIIGYINTMCLAGCPAETIYETLNVISGMAIRERFKNDLFWKTNNWRKMHGYPKRRRANNED